jgi:hypothetical protein
VFTSVALLVGKHWMSMNAYCGASPAEALLGATHSLRIDNPGAYLQFRQVEAFSSGVNVALASNGATAAMSSQYGNHTPASNCIDGNIPGVVDGGTYANEAVNCISASGGGWLEITFAAGYNIDHVVAHNRVDGAGERAIGATITLRDAAGNGQWTSSALDASAEQEFFVSAVAAGARRRRDEELGRAETAVADAKAYAATRVQYWAKRGEARSATAAAEQRWLNDMVEAARRHVRTVDDARMMPDGA